MWPHVGHLIKGPCLGTSYTKLAPCLVWYQYIFCRYRYLFYLSRNPTRPLHSMSCIYMRENSLQHVTTLKNLVIIGILIVKRKVLHQKYESYKYALPLKNWVDWINTRQQKNVTNSKMYILRRSAQNLKKHIFLLITTFYNFSINFKDRNQLS